MTDLASEVKIWNDLKSQLQEEYSLEDGDEALVTTLEGATSLNDRIAALIRAARENEAFISTLCIMIDELKERKSRLANKMLRLKRIAAWALEESGQNRLREADFTASLTHAQPELIIGDEIKAMALYPRHKIELDRVALRAAMENFQTDALEVAHFGNSKSILTIRTR